MLDANIKAQLAQYLEMMEKEVQLKISAGSGKVAQDMHELVDELASMSSLIKVEKAELERTPSFSINRPGEDNRHRICRYSARPRIHLTRLGFATCKRQSA